MLMRQAEKDAFACGLLCGVRSGEIGQEPDRIGIVVRRFRRRNQRRNRAEAG
jgi:hypothetical protein